jgi:uncharacterized membrane protein YgcG
MVSYCALYVCSRARVCVCMCVRARVRACLCARVCTYGRAVHARRGARLVLSHSTKHRTHITTIKTRRQTTIRHCTQTTQNASPRRGAAPGPGVPGGPAPHRRPPGRRGGGGGHGRPRRRRRRHGRRGAAAGGDGYGGGGGGGGGGGFPGGIRPRGRPDAAGRRGGDRDGSDRTRPARPGPADRTSVPPASLACERPDGKRWK